MVFIYLWELREKPRDDTASSEYCRNESEVRRYARAEGDGKAVKEVVRGFASVG